MYTISCFISVCSYNNKVKECVREIGTCALMFLEYFGNLFLGVCVHKCTHECVCTIVFDCLCGVCVCEYISVCCIAMKCLGMYTFVYIHVQEGVIV